LVGIGAIKMADVDKYILWVGSAIVFITLAVTFFLNDLNFYVILLFGVGVILVLGILTRYSECGNKEDERLKKIAAFSMMNSWTSIFMLLAMLLVLSTMNIFTELSTIQIMCLVMFMMLLVYYGWYVYYGFKGDVDQKPAK
jgi:hypothetical protein